MLASLNSVRVLAEFWVVHIHVAPRSDVAMYLGVRDLMSFFFVLSGFVLAHAHRDHDLSTWEARRAFWWRRWSKTYPVYIFFWCVYILIENATQGRFLVSPCWLGQLVMIDGWMGCELKLANGVSWYISALAWAWLAFPWLLAAVRRATCVSPWVIIAALWVVDLGIDAVMLPKGYLGYYPFPAPRAIEFTMGCVTATTIQTRLHWSIPFALGVLLLAWYLAVHFMYESTGPCEHEPFYASAPDSYPCAVIWYDAFCSKYAMAWAVLIHWLASSEHLDHPHWLSGVLRDNHVLRTLSTFSLQLYLGHFVIFTAISEITKRADSSVSVLFMFIFIYGGCYWFYLYVQPLLDRAVLALGDSVARQAWFIRACGPAPQPCDGQNAI